MINFITARAGRKQSESVYRFVRSLPDSEKAFLIVPDRFTYETERKILGDKSADLKTEVLSLKRLAYRMESSLEGVRPSVLSGEAEAILIKRAVNLTAQELDVYKSVSRTQGFCEEVMEFIDEMKKGGIYPENLNENDEDASGIRGKIKDIKKIYEKYLSLIPEGYMSSDEYFSYISKMCEDSDIIQSSHFCFDGFYSFDKSEYPLIGLIMRKAKSVTFSLVSGSGPHFAPSAYTLKELMGITEEYSLEYTLEENTDTSLLSEEGIFLEENLMGYDTVSYPSDTGRINLISAEDIAKECDCIASEINRLIRVEGYRYSDFQVICTDKSYFAVLKDTFERHSLEFFIDENREISSTSAVRAFLYIIQMLDGTYTSTEIISFAKSGFSGLSDDEYMLLENYVLETGIKGRMWESDFVKNNQENSYDTEYINSLRIKLISPVLAIRKKIAGYADVSEFTSRLVNSLEEINFEEIINGYIEEFISRGDYENANIYSQINNKILDALTQLESFFGEEYLSESEIYDMLAFCLSGCRVGIIPSRVDAVSIGDVIRSANKNTKIMFITGCAEGLMPHSSSVRPILSDSERNALKGFELKATAEYLRKRENYVYYSFICAPKDRLYLSYSASDGENYPSVMFERIRELFPYCNFSDASDVLKDPQMVDTEQYAFSLMNEIVSSMAETPDQESLRLLSAVKEALGKSGEEYVRFMEEGNNFANEAKLSDKKAYHSVMTLPLVTSVSMLESYGKCPFMFFMDYVVRPKKRRLRTVKSTDIGSILHKVVEEFSKMIIKGKTDVASLSDEEIEIIAQELAGNAINSYKDGIIRGISYSKYLTRKIISSSVSAVKELVSQLKLSDFEIAESEAPFGPGGKYSSMVLSADGEDEVYVKGIIDRIDYAGILGGKYLKIIDYKSSKRTFDLSKLAGKISFQLPAYALAAGEGRQVAGVYYFKLKNDPVSIKGMMSLEEIKNSVRKQRKLSGLTLKDMDIILALDKNARNESFISNVNVKKDNTLSEKDGLFTREEFESLLCMAKENMSQVAGEILRGEIPIKPYRFGQNENACTYCEYAEICKFNSSFEENAYRNIEKINKNDLKKEHSDG